MFKLNGEPVILTDSQCDIFNAICDQDIKRLQIETPTQYGKSLTVALAVIYYRLVYGGRIVIIAPKREQANIIMDYIIQHLFDRPEFYKGLEKEGLEKMKTRKRADYLVWENGDSIRVLTAGASNSKSGGAGIMGFGADLVISDESALIPDKIYSKILRMLGGNLEKSKLVKIGNPFHRNHFYKTHKIYDLIHIDYEQAIEEQRLTKEYVEEMRKMMPEEDFKVLYEVKFPDSSSSDAIIPSVYIENAKEIIFKDNELYVGIDVARGGSDESVLTIISIERGDFEPFEIGNVKIVKSISIPKLDNGDLVVQSDEILAMLNGYDIQGIGVDVVGVGGGLADMLRSRTNIEVVDFIAGSKSEKDGLANRKTEIIYLIRSLMGAGLVSLNEAEEKLITQLGEYTKVRMGRNIKSVDPDDSPDWADSFVIALHTALKCDTLEVVLL